MDDPERLKPAIEPQMKAARPIAAHERGLQEAYSKLARYTSLKTVEIFKDLIEQLPPQAEGNDNGKA